MVREGFVETSLVGLIMNCLVGKKWKDTEGGKGF